MTRPGQWEPDCGEFLGDLKNECEGEIITHFVSAGPKNYAYKLSSGEEVCKIRGFTLNYRNRLKLNFDAIANLILHREETSNIEADLTTVDPCAIKREKNVIFTGQKTKKYRVVYDKRFIGKDLQTYPF